MRELDIPLDYIGLAAAYGALYVAAAMALAVVLFQRKVLEPATASGVIPGAVSLLAWLGRTAALLIAGGVVLTALSSTGGPTLRGLGGAGAVAALAAVAWVVWTFFAMGARWSYWLILTSFVVLGVMAGAGLLGLQWARVEPLGRGNAWCLATGLLACVVVWILLLPRTRYHFKSSR